MVKYINFESGVTQPHQHNQKEKQIMADKEKAVLDAMTKVGVPMKAGEVAEATGLDNKEVAKIRK